MSVFLLLAFLALLCGLAVLAIRQIAINVSAPGRHKAAFRAISNFTPTVVFAGTALHPGVAIDADARRFALAQRKGPPKVMPFESLVQVEITRNGASLEITNRGSQIVGAAVGGILLGGLGLLIGGLSGSKRKVEKVKQLSLKLYTTDVINPVHELMFFEHSKGLPPTDALVKAASKRLEDWYGRFSAIQKTT